LSPDICIADFGEILQGKNNIYHRGAEGTEEDIPVAVGFQPEAAKIAMEHV
jgi:hypothetical protein